MILDHVMCHRYILPFNDKIVLATVCCSRMTLRTERRKRKARRRRQHQQPRPQPGAAPLWSTPRPPSPSPAPPRPPACGGTRCPSTCPSLHRLPHWRTAKGCVWLVIFGLDNFGIELVSERASEWVSETSVWQKGAFDWLSFDWID